MEEEDFKKILVSCLLTNNIILKIKVKYIKDMARKIVL